MYYVLTQILGEPSISLMKEMGEEEAQRVTKQQEKLGKDGLQKMANRLQQATEENEVSETLFRTEQNRKVSEIFYGGVLNLIRLHNQLINFLYCISHYFGVGKHFGLFNVAHYISRFIPLTLFCISQSLYE